VRIALANNVAVDVVVSTIVVIITLLGAIISIADFRRR
jgi:hypothetical protein